MQAAIITNSPLTFSITNFYQHLEKLSITIHLSLTENLLRAKNIDHLDSELQTKRLQSLDYLHEYWTAGKFPVNTDFPNSREPYFRDNYGTLCAMAYILHKSGYEDLVNTVNKTNNNVYINDINGGPVIDAIHNLGLTKKEAARIQPTYGPCGMNSCDRLIFMAIFYVVALIVSEVMIVFAIRGSQGQNIIIKILSWIFLSFLAVLFAYVITVFSGSITGYY